MSRSPLIRTVTARPVVMPLRRPVRTAVGTVSSAPLVLIDVEMDDGPQGSAYIFAYTTMALPALARLTADIGAIMAGLPAHPVDRMRDADRRFRLLGWQGLVGMAVSGLDMALWDAHAKRAGQSVAEALGATPRPVPAYDSYGVIDIRLDAGALRASVDRGFRAIKIKLGDGEAANDVATTSAVRNLIGPDVALMIDFNQSLSVPDALRRIRLLEHCGISWVEEPVRAEDLDGHARIRRASPAPIQTGENWWFPAGAAAAVAAGASDYAMLDIMKIGGVTGWMQAAALCAGAGLPVSSHIFVEASAHVLAATPGAHWIEYLDLAQELVLDPPALADGAILAKGPGLGLAWNEEVVQRHLI